MKYLYIKVMLVLIHVFDLLPFWLISSIFFNSKNKFTNVNFCKNNSKDLRYKNEILIWMDYSNAIGDFFAILKSVIKFDKLEIKYSLLVHKKFFGIIESLNLKNATIIYKENSLGSHYSKNKDSTISNINKINNEFSTHKLSFRTIYYFNGILLCDALTAITNIEYGELKVLDPRVFLRGRNSKYIDRNYMDLSLHYLVNNRHFKVNIIKFDNFKSLSINDIVDSVLGTENIKMCNQNSNKSNKNYIVVSAGASNSTKVLREDILIATLKNLNIKSQFYLVGSSFDKKFIKGITTNKPKRFNTMLDLSLMELIDLVRNADCVVSYDTGLHHIATFFDKKNILIVNKNDYAYKYMSNYWLGKCRENEKRIVLKSKSFYK